MLLAFLLLLIPGTALATDFAWDWPAENADITGFRLYRAQGLCAANGIFALTATFPKVTSGTETDVLSAGSYCWMLTSFNASNMESVQSNKVEKTIVVTGPTLEERVTALEVQIALLSGRVTALDTVMTGRIATLESQLAGVCRAAKQMGGSATSLAGRLRKEIPCP